MTKVIDMWAPILPTPEILRHIRALITGFDERSSAGKTFVPNALVGRMRDAYPDRSSHSPGSTF